MNQPAGVGAVNALPLETLVERLYASCHLPVRSFAEAVAARRPFGSLDDLIAVAQDNVDELTAEQVVLAHTGLDRIGIRIVGDDHESRWSRDEESGIRDDEDTQRAFTAANEAYEQRFGHVFLISATGRSGEEILAELRRRTANDDATETETIKGELRKLVAIRLPKMLDSVSGGGR